MKTVRQCLEKMLDADPALYQKCLDTPGFAFWFNELARVAERGEDAGDAVRLGPDRGGRGEPAGPPA